MDKKLNIGVVIVAGGSGTRMGGVIPKQFRIAGGMPLLTRTINTFAEAFPSSDIVVVLPESRMDFWRDLTARFKTARHRTVAGGSERFHSVKAGIGALGDEVNYIAVHDGVRALCTRRLALSVLQCAIENETAVPVIAPADSFRIVGDDGSSRIVDRAALRAVQTPQIFAAAILRRAYDTAYNPAFTDDASVVEHSGIYVTLCEGEKTNIKITTPHDLAVAEAWLDPENEDLRI